MADMPNYLEDIRRSLERSRGARRQRMDTVLSSLDEAGRMDRLQGVEVSDFNPEMDSGTGPIIQTGGGGGGTPVQTAAWGKKARSSSRSQSGPPYVAPPQGGCANGRCGIRSNVVTQAPMATVVTQSAPSTTVSAPTATAPVRTSAPTMSAPMSPVDSLRALRDAAVGDFRANGAYDPIGGVAASRTADYYQADAQAAQVISENERARDFARPAQDAAIRASDAAAQQSLSEAEMNRTTARIAGQAHGVQSAQDARSLYAMLQTDLTPQDYADSMAKLRKASASTGENGKLAIPAVTAAAMAAEANKYNEDIRRAFGAKAIKSFIRSSQMIERAGATPAEQTDMRYLPHAVGKDPNTGAPMDIQEGDYVLDRAASDKMSALHKHDMQALVSGYAQTGLLGQDWDTVYSTLKNDILDPLRDASESLYMARHADRLNELRTHSPDAYEQEVTNLRDNAHNTAAAYFDYVTEEMRVENAKRSGGWGNVSAWGAAPPQ